MHFAALTWRNSVSTARFMQLSTPSFWAAVTTVGSEHSVSQSGTWKLCGRRSAALSQVTAPTQPVSWLGLRCGCTGCLRAFRMDECRGWELFWTLNSAATVFKGVESFMKRFFMKAGSKVHSTIESYLHWHRLWSHPLSNQLVHIELFLFFRFSFSRCRCQQCS